MSGGHFQYRQWEISHIADAIDELILDNDSDDLDEYGYTKGTHFGSETIAEFKIGLELLRRARIYTQRIDWLVSADDGEDAFHIRLRKELDALEKARNNQ